MKRYSLLLFRRCCKMYNVECISKFIMNKYVWFEIKSFYSVYTILVYTTYCSILEWSDFPRVLSEEILELREQKLHSE